MKRNEDFQINAFKLDGIEEYSTKIDREVKDCKYLTLRSMNLGTIKDKVKFLLENNVDIKDKIFVVDIDTDCFLTQQQCRELEEVKKDLENAGAIFKIKDGDYWDLEDVAVAANHLDDVINAIQSAEVEENGEKRPLNEMEKFLWAYSYVANRKYKKNEIDLDSPRKITSIMKTGDCVCVGFATILKALCDRLNIECYMNSCQVYDKIGQKIEGHCNNVVVLNGKAYYCDSCWDCLSDPRRPRRTFANCLISFDDRKDTETTQIYDLTAPYADITGDVENLQNNLNEILSKETLTELEFKEYTNLSIANRLSRYMDFIPKYKYNNPVDIFMNRRNYKAEAVYYYSEALKLIESRRNKQPIQLEDFEHSLYNIYKAMGNSEEKSQEKVKLDIDATIAEAGIVYGSQATNCFARAYYQNLEV